ncbi:MAG: hypothetical protein GKR96_02800 [Gammaproteobacteria bacterium]|nr:hypothetical protein [Gammaproteobacteria bacterium]
MIKATPKWLYDRLGGIAEVAKVLAQMSIGVILVAILITKFACQFPSLLSCGADWLSYIRYVHQLPTLEIVSKALAYSAGIELAYMLFTPGPDEAIEPLITGTAAAVLYLISKNSTLEIAPAVSVLLFVFALASLFLIKEIFIGHKKDGNNGEAKKPLLDLLRKTFSSDK